MSRRTGAEWTPVATHVSLPGTSNLRDLGGTPVGERVVAPRRLYRAEALVAGDGPTLCSIWNPGNGTAYRALGVRTVLDLRSAAEAVRERSAWPSATEADYVALPIDEGGEGDTNYVADIRAGRRSRFTADDMADYYSLTLRRRGAEFAAGVRVIADADRLPVLVHCAAGKDRTGLLVALVLEALGAEREVVVADYALTGALRPDRVLAYAHLFEGTGVDLTDVALLFDSPAEAMSTALERLDAEFGSVAGYLTRACGLELDVLTALRANLLVDRSALPGS
jgi:protein-tyrosine phosphatase